MEGGFKCPIAVHGSPLGHRLEEWVLDDVRLINYSKTEEAQSVWTIRVSCLKRKRRQLAAVDHQIGEHTCQVFQIPNMLVFDGVGNWITWSKPTLIWREHASPHSNSSVRFEQCWKSYDAPKHRVTPRVCYVMFLQIEPPCGQPFPFVPCGCTRNMKICCCHGGHCGYQADCLVTIQMLVCVPCKPNTEYKQDFAHKDSDLGDRFLHPGGQETKQRYYGEMLTPNNPCSLCSTPL